MLLDNHIDLRGSNSISSYYYISSLSYIIINAIQLFLGTRLPHHPPMPQIQPSPKIPKNDPNPTHPISTSTHYSEALVAVQSRSVSGRTRAVV